VVGAVRQIADLGLDALARVVDHCIEGSEEPVAVGRQEVPTRSAPRSFAASVHGRPVGAPRGVAHVREEQLKHVRDHLAVADEFDWWNADALLLYLSRPLACSPAPFPDVGVVGPRDGVGDDFVR